jgi:hypothetical protein
MTDPLVAAVGDIQVSHEGEIAGDGDGVAVGSQGEQV